MRILAVDPGMKRIGIALSDPSNTLSSPLIVLNHTSRNEDAEKIIELANQHDAELILIGQALTYDGEISFEGRRAKRLMGSIKKKSSIRVILWDESNTTQKAQEIQRDFKVSQKNRRGHLDDHAAAVLLQNYIDSQETNN